MEWVETTGRTVEEAKDAALDELGVDESDAEFEVVEEPKMGLFGRIRAEARVRARVRPTTPRPKDDRRDRRRRRSERGGGASDPDATPTMSQAVGDDPEPAEDTEQREERSVATEMGVDERLELARSFVAGVVECFGFAAAVDAAVDDEETFHVSVSGTGLGLLIGPRGTTLAALQELTRTAVQRRTGAIGERIVVDVGGYWQRRREALERFAQQVAEEVRASGVRKVLEPMSAADRKAVHDAVTGIDGVSTSSEGEEPRRRVVIIPDATR